MICDIIQHRQVRPYDRIAVAFELFNAYYEATTACAAIRSESDHFVHGIKDVSSGGRSLQCAAQSNVVNFQIIKLTLSGCLYVEGFEGQL